MAALDDIRTQSIHRAPARIFSRPLLLRHGSLTPATLQPKTRRRAPPDARRRAPPPDFPARFSSHSIRPMHPRLPPVSLVSPDAPKVVR